MDEIWRLLSLRRARKVQQITFMGGKKYMVAWPPLVQDQKCEAPASGEAYNGQKCTGAYLTPGFPAASSQTEEDYPGPQDSNAIVGERVVFQI